MARIAGVDIPSKKRIEISLTYIYGVGKSISNEILKKTSIDKNTKVENLTDQQLDILREAIRSYRIEGDLKRQQLSDIKRLKDLGNYRGIRHRRGLPVRGQNTKNNARTRKGRRKMVVGGK